MVATGSWFLKNQWPHDGNPYEAENFVVYSDGSGMAARRRLAQVAEELLVELSTEMGIDPDTMFKFPPDQGRKIDLYSNRYNLPDWGGGARGYYAGLIIWSLDHEAETGRPTDLESYKPVLKHELVHVIESLLQGRFVGDLSPRDPRRIPVWFSEGMAEALTGGTAGGAITDLDRIDELADRYGEFNPTSMAADVPLASLPDPLVYFYQYYPMFGLAVEYLIDSDGLGNSPSDLTRVMLDIADDVTFAAAFETHMGISLSLYEEEFFERMAEYLPERSAFLPIAPVGLALLLVAASLVWWRIRDGAEKR